MRACLAVALLLAACETTPLVCTDAGPDAPVLDAPGLDAPVDASGSDARVGPDPSCLVPDVAGMLSLEPAMPRAGTPLSALASDAAALTNVEVTACTPAGPVAGGFVEVTGSYTWRFDLPELPLGETQIIFRSDPAATVRATLRVTPTGGTDAGLVDAGPVDGGRGVCGPLAGSLIDGTFEAGLSGMAPPGWQVRDPALASGCPEGTLSIVVGDPACGTSALLIDARGRWDCYAIQTFTDYATIEPGRTYRIHARVRSEAQDNPAAWFVVGLQWLDGSDAVFGDEKNPRLSDVNYDWTVIEWDLVAPAGARRAVIWLSGHYPGRVTYDDVSIALVP
jgi:hypothetical protein